MEYGSRALFYDITDQEVEEKIQSAVQVLDSGFQAKVRVERSYT